MISQTAILVLLYGRYDCFEGFWIVYGEVGENLTVELETFFLHPVDELGIREAEFAGSVVDASNPEGTKVALAIATVAISVAKGFDDALLGEAKTTSAIMLHTLCRGKDFLVFGMGRNATFDSHIKLLVRS